MVTWASVVDARLKHGCVEQDGPRRAVGPGADLHGIDGILGREPLHGGNHVLSPHSDKGFAVEKGARGSREHRAHCGPHRILAGWPWQWIDRQNNASIVRSLVISSAGWWPAFLGSASRAGSAMPDRLWKTTV